MMGKPGPFRRALGGIKKTLATLQAVAKNRDVRKAYGFILLALVALATLISLGGIAAVIAFTRSAEQTSTWLLVTMWILRVVGALIVLVAAPLLSIMLCNVLFPVFSEIPFLAGMRALSPSRATRLEEAEGLPLSAAILNSLRRLIAVLFISAGCFLLGLIPVVGPLIAAPLQFFWMARIVGAEMLDPYFDRLGLDWAAQKAQVARLGPEIWGHGAVCVPLLAIPLVGPLFFGLLQASTAGLVIDLFPEGEEATHLLASRS